MPDEQTYSCQNVNCTNYEIPQDLPSGVNHVCDECETELEVDEE